MGIYFYKKKIAESERDRERILINTLEMIRDAC